MASLPSGACDEIDALVRADAGDLTPDDLFYALSDWYQGAEKPVALVIDEAGERQVVA